jgi:hypothetical protein
MSEQNCVGILACILFAVIAGASAALPQELVVDWKFYGGASLPNDGYNVCFYDASGVVREPDNHIRVWTKCLPQKDIDNVDIKKDFGGKILENTAEKVAHHYMPPFGVAEVMDADQSMQVTEYEEVANISGIEPHARIFYELNCPERMLRELSLYVQENGKSGLKDKPSDWKYVPPEGNGARLLKILCPLPKF